MSHRKAQQAANEEPQEYSRSSTKRLFESVFRMLDHDELEISSFEQPVTNGSRVLSILRNESFLYCLLRKLRQQNLLGLYPILRVRCLTKKGLLVKLDLDDLRDVFQKFGTVYAVYDEGTSTTNSSRESRDIKERDTFNNNNNNINNHNNININNNSNSRDRCGYGNNNNNNSNNNSNSNGYGQLCYDVMYTSFCSCYVAMKLLNGFVLRNTLAQLRVEWCNMDYYARFGPILHQYHHAVDWNQITTGLDAIDNMDNMGMGMDGHDGQTQQQYSNGNNNTRDRDRDRDRDMHQHPLMRKESTISNTSNSTANTSNMLKQCKLTCRYDIQIENEKDFQVARRIIGSKGTNMKKIIESALALSADYKENEPNYYTNNQVLKLRLRGRGSGYKEGPEQIQSEEELHLCISAKDEAVYSYACQCVEKLLQGVYQDYMEFTRKQGKGCLLEIKKCQIGTNGNNGSNGNNNIQNKSVCMNVSTCTSMNMSMGMNENTQPNTMNINMSMSISMTMTTLPALSSIPTGNSENSMVMRNLELNAGRMESAKIQHYLELRNKARRELNFAEADRIRNYLRACGVCLIDEKGRRGKATEVTTWKYLL